jgi:hypothetical protein
VEHFESRQGLTLPKVLADFLLEHNGAIFNWDSWPAYKIHGHPRQTEGLLQCLFPLAEGDPIDIEERYRVHKDRLPAPLLAIGSDPGDNLICIGLEGEHQERIYWWERTKEEDSPTFRNVFLLAESLPEFIAGLYRFEG